MADEWISLPSKCLPHLGGSTDGRGKYELNSELRTRKTSHIREKRQKHLLDWTSQPVKISADPQVNPSVETWEPRDEIIIINKSLIVIVQTFSLLLQLTVLFLHFTCDYKWSKKTQEQQIKH